MKTARIFGALVGSTALFLAACGAEENLDPSAGVEDGADESSKGEEPESDTDKDGDDPAEDPGSDEDGQPDADSDFTSSLVCDETFTGTEADNLDDYTDLYLDVNYDLEQLATDVGNDIANHHDGELGTEEFIAQLEGHSAEYEQRIEPALEVGPPEEAADWHENAVDSWNSVCQTIADAHEGAVNDDEAQLDQAYKAVTEDPNLISKLHTNTMAGPGENV